MKRIVLLTFVALCLAPSSLMAQKPSRFEAGGFINYFRLSPTDPDLNHVGLGGRFSFRIARHAQLEAEMAYDLSRNFDSPWTAPSSGAVLPFNTKLRTFHALFGPKFNLGNLYGGRIQPFVTIKGGWLDFNAVSSPDPNFTSGLGKIVFGGKAFDGYGAAGLEAFRGRWGVRFEMGDEVYYDGTGHHNLRIAVGPQFRF